MWQGLQTISDYKKNTSPVADIEVSLLDNLYPLTAAGPDGLPNRILRACAYQLAGVFTDILNQSLSQSAVPTCFKRDIIVPVPKKAKVTELPDILDPFKFSYRPNRSTDDAITLQ